MRPRWVDFHCHVDLYPDHIGLIAECDRKRVATLAVTTTLKAWRRNKELAEQSRYVRVALGLHPQLVAERADEVTLFEDLLAETRYVGEVGLDAGPRYYRSFADQERVFARTLASCAEQGDKILSIHSVRAVGKVLEHLEARLLPDRGRAVLHWFTGTASEAKRAAELGCYFSINAEMMRSPKHRSLVAKLPADRLLTETDGPFVTIDNRSARPVDVAHTLTALASTLALTPTEVELLVIRKLANLTRA
jgi:TatD DNase family protein